MNYSKTGARVADKVVMLRFFLGASLAVVLNLVIATFFAMLLVACSDRIAEGGSSEEPCVQASLENITIAGMANNTVVRMVNARTEDSTTFIQNYNINVAAKKGTIILATVKGDIHDIGKNIVKVLLENYSFEVVDLGRDVAPERIVKAAVDGHISLVGLSALMTTTVPGMEETIKKLRKEAPWVKIMVGGAVLTEDYAMEIGADAYCRDGMASVNYAQKVFGQVN